MSLRARLPSKPVAFAILMAVAAAVALLPTGWVAWLRGPFQLLGLPQWALVTTVYHAREAADAAQATGMSPEQCRRLEEENEALRRLAAQQHAWLADLEDRYDVACGIRGQLWSDSVDIVVAPVLGYDSSTRRDTLLIGRGAESDLVPGQWVAAGVAPEDWPAGQTGGQLLLREWLVGRIAQVQTHTSRVELASDPAFRELVAVAADGADGTWRPDPKNYVLSGRGHGRMVISQADKDFAALGYGPVLVPPAPALPAMLSLGRVASAAPLEESALHFDVEVRPWADVRRLRHVYVIVVRP